MASDSEVVRLLKNLDRNFSAAVTMYQSISNNQAIQNKLIIELIEDMKAYRVTREMKEAQGLTGKFDQLVNQRFGLLWWLIDKIAPGVGVVVAVAILKKLNLI